MPAGRPTKRKGFKQIVRSKSMIKAGITSEIMGEYELMACGAVIIGCHPKHKAVELRNGRAEFLDG